MRVRYDEGDVPVLLVDQRAMTINKQWVEVIKHAETQYITRAERILGMQLPDEVMQSRLSKPPVKNSVYWRVAKLLMAQGQNSYHAYWLAGMLSPAAKEDLHMLFNAPMTSGEREEAVLGVCSRPFVKARRCECVCSR